MSRDDARMWRAAGLEALRRGKPAQALKAFDRALALGGDPELLGVLRARAHAEAGDLPRALTELREIGRTARTDARVEAARELAFLGALPEALTIAEDVLASTPRHRAALELSIEAAKLGWIHEAARAITRAIAMTGGDPRLHLRAAGFYESLRDYAQAIAHAKSALAADAGQVDAWLALARASSGAGQTDAALHAAQRAEGLVAHQSSRLREIALLRLAAGDPRGAERTLRAALDRAPNDRDTMAWLAELALHRLALDDAEQLAARVLAGSDDHPRALSVRGGARVMRGEPAAALPDLERAAIAGDPIAQHWLGDALRRLGRYDEAVTALDLAVVRASRYALTAHANRLLALIEQSPDVGGAIDPDAYAELVVALAPLSGEPTPEVLAGAPSAVGAHLRAAIDALAGNRTQLATRLEGSELVAIDVRPNSRTAARYQQELLRSRPIDEVLSGFDALLATYGELPTLHCHRGEVHLWIGQNAEAARCFARAIELDARTRWAWIGLGASRMMAGELDAAARAFDDALVHAPPAGRTIHVYRGELALLRGDLRAARADLERSLEINPERLSATLLLALALSASGERNAAHARIARARLAAPGLFHDVARASEIDGPEAEARVALSLMRGNRSAGFVTYFTKEGHLRFVPVVPADALAPRPG